MEMIALSPFNEMLDLHDIIIYDSTLRDGEQMPGVAFSREQKVSIANMLDEIGVPQIEAGFPAVSEREVGTIKEISSLGLNADILGLCRVMKKDIDCAAEAGVDMALLFVATSDIHLTYKLRKSRECILERVGEAIEYCKERGLKASFSCEDSTRTDMDFLLQVLRTAEEAGADRLGLTDTLGCATPEAIDSMVRTVTTKVGLPVSMHLHNDFGLALPNAIAAVKAGAKAITTTVNGMGERAGNVPLEQFVTAMRYLYGIDMGIDTTRFTPLCRTVAEMAGHPLSINHPLVGENAFSHESGIHVAAILNCPATYESIPPELVGNRRSLLMGKHSGASFIRKKLSDLELEATDAQVCEILDEVKRLGESRGRVGDTDFKEIAKRILG